MASKSKIDNSLVVAILFALIGLIMLVLGNGSISLVFWITGVLYILLGIIQIVTKTTDVKGGIVTIVIGIIFIIIVAVGFAQMLAGIILILSALPAVLGSTPEISKKFGMEPVDSGSATLNKIFTIVLLVVGVCLVAGYFFATGWIADILIRIGGLVLLAIGLIDLSKAIR